MRRTRMGTDVITIDELGDRDAILVQITSAKIKSFSTDYLRGGDEKVVLTFAEFGDAELILNSTSFRALSDRYGNDQANGFRAWTNKPCVLIKEETNNPQTGETIQAVWVARPEKWRQVVEALKKMEDEEARPATKPARARKGKAKP